MGFKVLPTQTFLGFQGKFSSYNTAQDKAMTNAEKSCLAKPNPLVYPHSALHIGNGDGAGGGKEKQNSCDPTRYMRDPAAATGAMSDPAPLGSSLSEPSFPLSAQRRQKKVP